MKKGPDNNFIKFLGTAGARFVMIRQLRSSAGIWISYKGTDMIVDPGPGCIVKCARSRPGLDPTKLDAILLTHRHLDHSNDINIMIEAMTEGGFKKRGTVFLPKDALDSDSIILKHSQVLIEKFEFLEEGKKFIFRNFQFQVPKRMLHPVDTYGIKFNFDKKSISLISDTKYFNNLEESFKADIIILNVVFYQHREGIQHLSFDDARKIITTMKPKRAILTHFGMTMLKAGPHALAEELKKESGIDVVAAYDGMTLTI